VKKSTKAKLPRYRDYRKKALADAAFKKAFQEPDEDVFIQIAHTILTLRRAAGMTQGELAKKIGTSQQAIARIESLDYKGHSLTTLSKLADAFKKHVSIQFV
jgi:DNA-binding XRE family transcriptional regulator